MAKNYESESKTNKNNAGSTSKNSTAPSEKNAMNRNASSDETTSGYGMSRGVNNSNSQNKSKNKASQSYQSEGNTSSRY